MQWTHAQFVIIFSWALSNSGLRRGEISLTYNYDILVKGKPIVLRKDKGIMDMIVLLPSKVANMIVGCIRLMQLQ